jgi:hypothetical protein
MPKTLKLLSLAGSALAPISAGLLKVPEVWRAPTYCSLSSPLRRFSAKRDRVALLTCPGV